MVVFEAWPGNARLAACFSSGDEHTFRSISWPFVEASEKCLEGQWYICGKTISRWCRADAAPEGARCCEWDFIEDYRGGRDTCCIGGYVAACKDDHVIHLGTCELPNANDPWAFHGIPDAAPATADGGAVDAMRSSQDSGTDD